jgi:hypothetical protein
MALPPDPPPYIAPIAEGRPEVMGSAWMRWFQATVFNSLASASRTLPAIIALTGQGAAIGTTNIPLPAITAGQYILSYYARITTAAGVSSSLTVTLGWTESSIPLTFSGVPMTGNTTTTVQSGSIMVVADGNTPLNYSTAYASNAAGVMKYRLTVIVQST